MLESLNRNYTAKKSHSYQLYRKYSNKSSQFNHIIRGWEIFMQNDVQETLTNTVSGLINGNKNNIIKNCRNELSNNVCLYLLKQTGGSLDVLSL